MVSEEFAGIRSVGARAAHRRGLPEPLERRRVIPMHVLFHDRFVAIYTDFQSFTDMVRASGLGVRSQADLDRLPTGEWDRFVEATTRFPNWEEMWDTALHEYETRGYDR